MTTVKRPDLPEFLALAFSPQAASALTQTNALARQLRDMPVNLLTDQIRDDRDRVLGEHLADLLAAHRDARAAGVTTADTLLVEGLEHVREEVTRIIDACRTLANATLATQRGFLEARYPATADDMLSTLPAVPAAVEAKPVDDANGEDRKLTTDALDALLPAKASAPTVMARRDQVDTSEPMRRRTVGVVIYLFFVLLVLCGLGYGIVYSTGVEREEAALAKAFPSKVAVAVQLDSVVRGTGPSTYDSEREVPQVAVKFHGAITNKADREALRVLLTIDILACPEGAAASCKVIETVDYDPTTEAQVLAGLTTKFQHTERIDIPNIDGTVKARLRVVGVSPFAEFRD